MIFMRLIFLIFFILLASKATSKQKQDFCSSESKFVTLKSNEVNLRAGPGKDYPVSWVIKSKNEPFEIVAEFDKWKKIRDYDGDQGWVHSSFLSYKTFVIVTSDDPIVIYKDKQSKDKKIAKAEKSVRLKLIKCEFPMCKVAAESLEGWVECNNLWGY
jgi:SH3-like domain-containing protein